MNPRLKIVFIVSSLRFGGAEKHTVQLFNGLPADSFDVALAYLKPEEQLLADVVPGRGTTWCADFNKGWDYAGLRRLSGWLQDVRPDVLVCVNTYPLFYGYLARALAGMRCRILEIFHSTRLPTADYRKMRWVYRRFFNRCDRVVYVSEAQRAHWERDGIHKDLGVVIHNGIDAQRFRDRCGTEDKAALRARFGFATDDFVVGICAALRPEKQHEDLIAAIAQLRAQGVAAKCLIIGDGPRRAAIERNVIDRSLQSDIAITGFQSDVRPFIAACDAMALVSPRIETFSIAALESMALGKPIVMSAVGGAAEQVREGVNGYLFPAEDVDALAGALRKLTDPVHRAQLGGNARAIVEREFAAQVMLDRYAGILAAEARR